MPRTTAALVRKVIKVSKKLSNADLDAYIEIANPIVTELCTNSGYTDERLEKIERYLSAHFLCVNYPRTTFTGISTLQASTEHKVDLGLRNTRYGQAAIFIDTAGNLAAVDNTQKTIKKPQGKLDAFWLGENPDDQELY